MTILFYFVSRLEGWTKGKAKKERSNNIIKRAMCYERQGNDGVVLEARIYGNLALNNRRSWGYES